MSKYWSARVKELVPYVPGEQPALDQLTKLNTNENPYGPSPVALDAMRAELNDGLRLYPDPNAQALKNAIADYYQLDAGQVFVGNGSDEVLAHAFLGLLKQDQPLLFPDISYSFYPVYCGLYDIPFEQIPLDEFFRLRVEDYSGLNGGVIFPNPNAPTGCLLPLVEIERLLSVNTETVVVVDEAYIDFGGESAVSLVDRYPNLLVVQTLSKSRSLAGMRVGFAMGHVDLIEGLERVKNSFNSYPLDRVAIAGAVAAFQDQSYFEFCREKVISERENMRQQLCEFGFSVLPSSANFLFCRHTSLDAATLSAGLRERGVIVRHFKQARIANFLRITIGTAEQNQKLQAALAELIAAA